MIIYIRFDYVAQLLTCSITDEKNKRFSYYFRIKNQS